MTPEQLVKIMPAAKDRAGMYCKWLNIAMAAYDIDTPARQAAFLAQVAHESGSLRYTQEIASGTAYEGRSDLGNTQPGDGVKFKGHGLLQITGRANHAACSQALFGDAKVLTSYPDALSSPLLACLSAAWFWDSKKLNALADVGDFDRITRRINGGLNGLDQRREFWDRAKVVFGLPDKDSSGVIASMLTT